MDLSLRAHWIAQLYYYAELAVLERARADIRILGEGDITLAAKARQFTQFERDANRILTTAHRQVIRELNELLEEAVREGMAAAIMDLNELGFQTTIMADQQRIINLIAEDLASVLSPAPLRALRSISDVYQESQAISAAQVALGSRTRIQASQRMFEDLIRRGVTGFQDRAGRNWHLDTYAEMAVRTGTMNAQLSGKLEEYLAHSHDLVYVTDSPRECGMCRPFENRVLALAGVAGTRTVASMTTGQPVTVDVVATVEEARGAGLFHPNCTHGLSAYLPGATRHDAPKYDDPELYAATQTQRGMERNVRHWQRRMASAVDPVEQAAAGVKVQEWRAELKAHVAEHPGLRRRYERENPFRSR